jgi:hypothetical protein
VTDEQADRLDDIWELAEFHVSEAYTLRAFLEYLRTWDDPPEKKVARLQNWRSEIGLQLGSPQVGDATRELFRKLRAAPPQLRSKLVREKLAEAAALYFGENAK